MKTISIVNLNDSDTQQFTCHQSDERDDRVIKPCATSASFVFTIERIKYALFEKNVRLNPRMQSRTVSARLAYLLLPRPLKKTMES